MLDLEALIGEMQVQAADVVRSARSSLRQREAATAQVAVARALPGLRDAVLAFARDMAMPAVGRDLGAVAPPPTPENGLLDYTVIATDGSQVAPDYHHIAPWAVINAGYALFRFGPPAGRARCRLGSVPRLLAPGSAEPTPQDPGIEADSDADALAAAGLNSSRLEAQRLVAELDLARKLVMDEGDPGRTVLLLDGPLVQWRMITALKGVDQEQTVAAFRRFVQTCHEAGVAVAGYISRSRAVEWVTLLRFSLCPEVQAGRALCPTCRNGLLAGYAAPAPGAHHAPLAGLRDIELARDLLPAGGGWRTEIIELRSATWQTISGGTGTVGFCYLDTGTEIARVEVPSWTWEHPERMALLHAALCDQCESGAGYPLVLAEAHEAAVVRAADREMFYTVLERLLGEHGVTTVSRSAKGESKRRPAA